MALFGKKSGSAPGAVTKQQVLEALRPIEDPDLDKDIVELDFVHDITIDGGRVAFTIRLTTPACPLKEEFRQRAAELVAALDGVEEVDVEMDAVVAAAPSLLAKNQVPGVKNVLAVSSGKGGVGKSTVAVNLACALARTGARVGILDADVYGPNVPIMLGLSGKPRGADGKIAPFDYEGLKVMSMAFLVAEDQPVIWRGPMLHSAVRQFLFDVQWGDVDYLIVDLPPGTGDAQLSLAQQAHLMGAVIVTTPQDVSVLDVKKAINMFKQVNVPVLGVIENMSGMAVRGRVKGEVAALTIEGPNGPVPATVAADGTFSAEISIFGAGGGERIAELFDVPLLGRVPLDPRVRIGGDSGRPVTIEQPDSVVARKFREISGELARRISTINWKSTTSMSV